MSIIERKTTPELAAAPVVTKREALGVFARPADKPGWKSWLTTVDHKKIGIMYGATALFFFVVGGCEALLIRLQLARPNGTVLSAQTYNEMFTMHATTMVFMFVMPMAAAFANYFLPLQVGARDVAFPRLNALSYWVFLFGGLFVNLGWFLGGAADGGWFAYAPNTGTIFSPSHGMDFWAIGLQIAGVGSLVGAVNLITTVLNMRAPGMKLMRMPIFTWMQLVVQFLLLFAVPVITVALFLLTFQREFGAKFFNVEAGADPLLWQHLFWIFGHPEVYILVLPAFGIVSEVLPVFSRKPLFGYPFVVFSGVAIGFMGWGVWAHHMFASGLGPISVAVFSATTMFIAVPTGVKIINWIATMWGGRLRFTVAMHYAVSLVALFTIGGLSGVTHAISPWDTQQTDTYYIVAHFHYTIFGGAVMGLFAGFYYWWPKIFGRMLDEGLGKVGFWFMVVGMNLTFGPMHITGLQGQPRRMYRYDEGMGFDFWNLVATIGSFTLAFGVLLFIINVWRSRKNIATELDPWDSRSLEWMTSNPPAAHNFAAIPTVHSIDEFWHRKYEEDADGNLIQVKTAEQVIEDMGVDDHIHMPSPSYWPIVVAFSMFLIGLGVIYLRAIGVVGALLLVGAVYAWANEDPTEPDESDSHGGPSAPSQELTPVG
ncbi:MAG: cytochrome c oxidase subunit I [Acidimicrobiia bacterium]